MNTLVIIINMVRTFDMNIILLLSIWFLLILTILYLMNCYIMKYH
jgi:hypothetical protein